MLSADAEACTNKVHGTSAQLLHYNVTIPHCNGNSQEGK